MIKIKNTFFLFIAFTLITTQLISFPIKSKESITLEKEKIELQSQVERLKKNNIENRRLLSEIERLKKDAKEVRKIEQILEQISNEPDSDEAKKLTIQNKKLKEELSEINKIRKNLEQTNTEKSRQLNNLKKEIETTKKSTQQIETLKKEIGQLKNEKNELQKKVGEQENKKKTSVNKLVDKLQKMNVDQKYIEKMKQKLTRSAQIEDEYNDIIDNLLTRSVRSIPIEYLLDDFIEVE